LTIVVSEINMSTHLLTTLHVLLSALNNIMVQLSNVKVPFGFGRMIEHISYINVADFV